MKLSEARVRLYQLVEQWRTAANRRPVYIGAYGAPEAVIAPMAVWQQLVAAAAEAWDLRTATARGSRVDDPGTVPRPTTLVELSDLTGTGGLLVPVLQSRGVPRGAADLEIWPGVVQDIQTLVAQGANAAVSTVLSALAMLLQGKTTDRPSHAGRGLVYTPVDVDGLHAVVLTTRRRSGVEGRRGRQRRGGREIVELVGVDRVDWTAPAPVPCPA